MQVAKADQHSAEQAQALEQCARQANAQSEELATESALAAEALAGLAASQVQCSELERALQATSASAEQGRDTTAACIDTYRAQVCDPPCVLSRHVAGM